MKIKGKDWMDWLHQVRRESQKQRKTHHRSLAKHLKLLEGKASPAGKVPSGLTRGLKTGAGEK
jgi:hypothetical protein